MAYVDDFCQQLSYNIQAVAVTLWAYSILKYDASEVFEALATRGLEYLEANEEISGQVFILPNLSPMSVFMQH